MKEQNPLGNWSDFTSSEEANDSREIEEEEEEEQVQEIEKSKKNSKNIEIDSRASCKLEKVSQIDENDM